MLFRQTNKWPLRLWTLLLVLSLLCSQSVTLHIHNLDHDHTSVETSDQGHLGKIHSAYDFSHGEHHDDAVYDVSGHSDGLLKNTSNTLFALAIFILPFALLLAAPLGQVVNRDREIKLVFYERHLFSPPLRAPPAR